MKEVASQSRDNGWMLGFNDTAMSKMITLGVGRSRRYCNTGYDQTQGHRHGMGLGKAELCPLPNMENFRNVNK